MSGAAAVLLAEWTKIRTLRSTLWTLLPAFVVGVGLAVLVGLSFRQALPDMSGEQSERFDPLFATFYGFTLAQLALVVFGVLVIGGEYTSGTIRASLAAVPSRGLFYCGKLLAGTGAAAVVSLATVPAAFFAAQTALGPYGVSPDTAGVAEAAVGAWLYLTLICVFAMGVASMLRSSVRSLAILLPLFFLGSQGLGNIPGVRVVTQYLPDQAGWVIMHLTRPGDPQFGRDYGAWGGMGILTLWAAAALLGGYLVLRRRDA